MHTIELSLHHHINQLIDNNNPKPKNQHKLNIPMTNELQCPHCQEKFNVEAAMVGKLEERYKEQYQKKLAEQSNRFQARQAELEKQKEEFEAKKLKENQLFKERLEQRMAKAEKDLELKTKEKFDLELKALQQENQERKEENVKLKQQELDFLKRERKLREKEENLKLNVEKKLLEQRSLVEEQVKAKEQEKFALKEKEWEKKLTDQKKLAEEMKRKSEQGSMQLQGEVQELVIEDILRDAYPFDNIEEIRKGARGADTVQTVINRNQQVCGAIVYESKRTKHFCNDWIQKIKQDQLRCKADIPVIVTNNYPKGMTMFGQVEGVWVCKLHEVKALSLALRQGLIEVQSVKIAEDNKGAKQFLLYDYFTSIEFAQSVRFLVEVYGSMSMQLAKEKSAMQKLWKQREKHIDSVKLNIGSIFGSIQAIAGQDLEGGQDILELPEPEES